MKEKIIVTGGAGYIGSHTILQLIRQNKFAVISIDNFSKSFPSTFERIKKITGEDIVNYDIDLCDLEKLDKVFKENSTISTIIHFAAYKSVPESVEKPIEYYENNILSLINILKICQKYSIKNLIFSSSCSVYGSIDTLPVDENTKLSKAESPYAYTKQIGENMIKDFAKTNNTKAISLRYFNPVGADISYQLGEVSKDKPLNIVPLLAKAAFDNSEFTVCGVNYDTRDGSCIRDYIHVLDIADAHIASIDYLKSNQLKDNYDVFNLGSGNGCSVFEAVEAFEKASEKKLNIRKGDRRPGDVPAIYSSSKKALEKLSWNTKYNIDDMMKTAWKWYLELNRN